jgi:hypothetical protein
MNKRDEEIIDENTLLDQEEEVKKPEEEMEKKDDSEAGVKKRACANCSCGLAEREKDGGAASSSEPFKSACGSVSERGVDSLYRVMPHHTTLTLSVPSRRRVPLFHVPVPRTSALQANEPVQRQRRQAEGERRRHLMPSFHLCVSTLPAG